MPSGPRRGPAAAGGQTPVWSRRGGSDSASGDRTRTRYSLLAARCLRLAACGSLLAARYLRLAACGSLLATRYLLLATRYSLLATRYWLLATRYSRLARSSS